MKWFYKSQTPIKVTVILFAAAFCIIHYKMGYFDRPMNLVQIFYISFIAIFLYSTISYLHDIEVIEVEKRKLLNRDTEWPVTENLHKSDIIEMARLEKSHNRSYPICTCHFGNLGYTKPDKPVSLRGVTISKKDYRSLEIIAKVMNVSICVNTSPWYSIHPGFDTENRVIFIPSTIVGRGQGRYDASTWAILIADKIIEEEMKELKYLFDM